MALKALVERMCRSVSATLLCVAVVALGGIGCERGSSQRGLTVAAVAGDESDGLVALASRYGEASVEVVKLPYATLRARLRVALSSNKSPYDLVMLDDPWLAELSEFLRPLPAIPEDIRDDVIGACLRLGRIPYPSGTQLALPFVGNCQLLFYRSDVMERLGLKRVPETWEEMASLARKMRGVGPPYLYCVRGRQGAPIVTDFLPILWSCGGRVLDGRGSAMSVSLERAPLVRALGIYKLLSEASPPAAVNYDWTEMTAEFIKGNVAFELNWPAGVDRVEKALGDLHEGDRYWSVTVPPGGEGGRYSMAGNWLLAIPKGVERAEDAWQLAVWMLRHQAEVVTSGNPPTLKSVFADADRMGGRETGGGVRFHYKVLRESLSSARPRPRYAGWQRVEEALSQGLSRYISSDMGVEAAADSIIQAVRRAVH